jgi:non-heme chloroperoxidase
MGPVSHVRVNGVDLEYVDEGTGTPVVFSHGGSSDIRYWEPQRAAFAARYRFVAYSRRFHGTGSWSETADGSSDAHTADLVGILRRLDVGPAHLVGFSTAIALRAALAEPGIVRSLTIIEPNVPTVLEGNPSDEAILAGWRQDTARIRAEAAGDANRQAALWFELVNNRGAGTFDQQPETFRQMWLDNFSARRPTDEPEPLTCEKLSAISSTTLALGAQHGMTYSRRILEHVADCIPNSRLAILPSVTHFMSYQEPDAFNTTVMDFLRDAS